MKFIFCLLFATTLQAHQIVMTKIETLNTTEPYAPMVFHQSALWLGRYNVVNHRRQHRLEVRTMGGEKLVSSISVPHSVERLYPLDADRIVVMGKAHTLEGWITYSTTARLKNGNIELEVNPISTKYQVEEFAGTPDRQFFNETGERGIVEINAFGTRLLPITISGPGKLQVAENSLWVLERNSFKFGDENIVRVNLATFEVERVFNRVRDGLSHILALQKSPWLATGEYFGEKLILIDRKNPALQKTIPLPGTHPRALTQWGHCVIVASEQPHRLSVVRLNTVQPELVFEFNLEPYAADLPNFKTLSVDPDSAAIYLRSAEIPEVGRGDRNSIYRFTHSGWIAACE
ncbi:hypothetical protein EBR78_06695 [bacterium]|nr:hypothetical protein [bacterium]